MAATTPMRTYISLLHWHGIRSSMTRSGDPPDKALVERINGIIKQECLHLKTFGTIEQVQSALEQYIDFYYL